MVFGPGDGHLQWQFYPPNRAQTQARKARLPGGGGTLAFGMPFEGVGDHRQGGQEIGTEGASGRPVRANRRSGHDLRPAG